MPCDGFLDAGYAVFQIVTDCVERGREGMCFFEEFRRGGGHFWMGELVKIEVNEVEAQWGRIRGGNVEFQCGLGSVVLCETYRKEGLSAMLMLLSTCCMVLSFSIST